MDLHNLNKIMIILNNFLILEILEIIFEKIFCFLHVFLYNFYFNPKSFCILKVFFVAI